MYLHECKLKMFKKITKWQNIWQLKMEEFPGP